MLGVLAAGCAAQATTETDRDTDSSTSMVPCLRSLGYHEALLDRNERAALTVGATIDSFEVRLLVDRRSPMSFFDRAALIKRGYEPEATETEINFGGTVEPLYTVTPRKVAIGTLVFDSVSFDVTRLEHIARASGIGDDRSIVGVLGADMLRRCGALLDIADDRLFLRAPELEVIALDTADTNQGFLQKLGEKLQRKERGSNTKQ